MIFVKLVILLIILSIDHPQASNVKPQWIYQSVKLKTLAGKRKNLIDISFTSELTSNRVGGTKPCSTA